MMDTVAFCPLCGSPGSLHFDQRIFRDQPVTNRLCSRCGLVYQSPRMDAAELAEFYQSEYRQLYQGSQGPSPRDLLVQSQRAESLLSFARPHLMAVSRHLDIGCSAGLLLESFHTAYACHAAGIEPGDAYRQHALRLGFPVYPDLQSLESAAGARFDLISLAHVLEHIPDPVDYLLHLKEHLLAPVGWLLVEVPNLYAHDSFEVAHLVSYSRHTLAQVLGKAGFAIAALEAHGRPRSPWLPLYLTVLAQPAAHAGASAVIPERHVAWKRRLGMLRSRLLTRLLPSRTWTSLPPAGSS
jgi:2-polyprenyl-3-methyl-5-hydroxy-6-metoxy-1,4-benzoquinol methylase